MKKGVGIFIISMTLIWFLSPINKLADKEADLNEKPNDHHQEISQSQSNYEPINPADLTQNDMDSDEACLTSKPLLQVDGKILYERFNPPEGYSRQSSPSDSFSAYLQTLPLKPHGEKVLYYDGRTKSNPSVYEAVIQMDVGSKDLQQCADAVMRLRGEYLFHHYKKDHIHFNLTNGFRVEFSKWMEGYRVKVDGNTTSWVKKKDASDTYETFRQYMEFVFIYAGTLSLDQELEPVSIETMKIGDVFIKGGSPGHAVIVVDMAENPSTGKKLYMLAQSYMPAQDIHILSNPNTSEISPWYALTDEAIIHTPEWSFKNTDLKRFVN